MKLGMKKSALTVAMAGALALACAPAAFAASPSVGGTSTFNNNEGHTDVKVATEAGQLSAEIPLNMTVVANAQGGALAGKPGGYKIVNKSYFAIQVATVKAEAAASSAWAYSNTSLTSASASGLNINLTLQPNGAGSATTLTSAGVDTSASQDWKVAAATGLAGTEKAIAVDGSTSPLSKSIGDAGEAAAKITYTIQAAS